MTLSLPLSKKVATCSFMTSRIVPVFGVGDAHPLLLVVAGGGDEGELFGVGGPLDVVPAAAAFAADVVAESGAVLVGRHFEADDLDRVEIEDHALDHGDVFVAGQGVLEGGEGGMAGGDVGEVHLAGLALVLLEGGDAFGVGRPDEDGIVGVGPAGVVGGVAEVLDAVPGELGLLAGGEVADPEIPIAEEGGFLAVRRDVDTGGAVGGAVATPAGGGLLWPDDAAGARAGEVAENLLAQAGELYGCVVVGELEVGDGQLVGIEGDAAGQRLQRRGELDLVEGGRLGAFSGIDEDEAGAAGAVVAIPEAAVGQPGGILYGVQDERVHVVRHKFLGLGVVLVGVDAGGLRER